MNKTFVFDSITFIIILFFNIYVIQTKALNGGGANLPAGCTPSCLKSSQLVRRASESNRTQLTIPGSVSELKTSLASISTVEDSGDGHPLLNDFTSLVGPEANNTQEKESLSAPVSDASIQSTRKLS